MTVSTNTFSRRHAGPDPVSSAEALISSALDPGLRRDDGLYKYVSLRHAGPDPASSAEALIASALDPGLRRDDDWVQTHFHFVMPDLIRHPVLRL
ncbi:hypothetical protein [Microbulbifer guangxiensis]|uniref:hypothetical protein n=1 Tax=Microbulbifer guangxiensis TaxID=2904249 RepID=UPI001F3E89C1|nr:hypothetical protein [Microbulbifer guangxiensis]